MRPGEEASAGNIVYADWTKLWMPLIQGAQGVLCRWGRGVQRESVENWQMPGFGRFYKPNQEV